jgi:dephospho-CoA kinase
MKIIWITGPQAAWKWEIVNYLTEKKWFSHYSVRWFLTQEIEKRWLPLDRDSMREVANDLRANYWPSYITDQLFLQAQKDGKDAIIESIRAIWEVESLKKNSDFILLAVNANQKLRFERAIARKSASDFVSFEKFQEQERLESENSDPSKQNINACINMADFVVNNDWDIEELHKQLDEIIK